MDYKFTFEDGSEAIAHHGVKGMKWGVRNAETLAKYGLKNANAAGGGGGVNIEDLDFDAEELGFKDNSAESKRAALGEMGLNENMTREEAIKKIAERNRKLEAERKAIREKDKKLGKTRSFDDALLTAKNIMGGAQADLKVIKSLPSEKDSAGKKSGSIVDKTAKTVGAVNITRKVGKEAVNLVLGKKNANSDGGSGGGAVSKEYLEEKEYNSKKNRYPA
jgi:hypothetical protein